ncbi:hypothetical protein BDA99DRAFT_531775 [Phascolomyces articulosus]|uniref:Uncharacterized protein n=1 Tax=Phascolomyces articulosus TaxID=60185 RepID=A0AAD5KAA8_9FUNG|nr:hypothetical protein BDA99DRAFT_531775 [Phascolomyces articulosus]
MVQSGKLTKISKNRMLAWRHVQFYDCFATDVALREGNVCFDRESHIRVRGVPGLFFLPHMSNMKECKISIQNYISVAKQPSICGSVERNRPFITSSTLGSIVLVQVGYDRDEGKVIEFGQFVMDSLEDYSKQNKKNEVNQRDNVEIIHVQHNYITRECNFRNTHHWMRLLYQSSYKKYNTYKEYGIPSSGEGAIETCHQKYIVGSGLPTANTAHTKWNANKMMMIQVQGHDQYQTLAPSSSMELQRDSGKDDCIKRPHSFKEVPSMLPKPNFMLSKLAHISDMKLVNGSQVTREAEQDDKGSYKSKIMENTSSIANHGKQPFLISKYVKFEGIIQQTYQQFNIKYIWFVQTYINQDNKEEKKTRIRNIHHIYGNVHYAGKHRGDKEYFKCIWTLEEAIKSNWVLFVGRDIRRYGEDISGQYPTTLLSQLIKLLPQLDMNEILYHALIRLFPEFIDYVDIDYEQPIENLGIRFYGIRQYEPAIQKYTFFPSWIGVNGEHIYAIDMDTPF